jgi:hypothetical protein
MNEDVKKDQMSNNEKHWENWKPQQGWEEKKTKDIETLRQESHNEEENVDTGERTRKVMMMKM